MNEASSQEHNWPEENEHLWSAWWPKTGLPTPSEYRICLHPKCKFVETRKTALS